MPDERRPQRRREAQDGIAIVAVLALLAAVSLLLVSYGTLATVNWLSARNLRQGLHAWSQAEAAIAVAVGELEEIYRRDAALPDAYVMDHADALGASVTYLWRDATRADIDVVATFGKAAVRRIVRVNMSL